jgi:predicted nucleic acid-binding protein
VTTAALRIVVADSNVLINLMHVSRLGLLAHIPDHEFVVPDHVREEITTPDQRAREVALLSAAVARRARSPRSDRTSRPV